MVVAELIKPVKTCHEKTTLREVQEDLAQGHPVALFWGGRWRLLLPQMAVSYPSTRLVVDLPLVDPPILSPTLSLAEAAEVLACATAPMGLVVEDGKLLGQVSPREVMDAIAEKIRQAAELGKSLGDILSQTRAVMWRYILPKELISSRGRIRPPTLQGLEIHGPLEDLLGYTLEEFKNTPDLWHSSIHPKDRPKVIRELLSLFSGKEAVILEYRFRRKDGSWVYLRDQVKGEHRFQGELEALTGVVTDVTEEMEERKLEALVHKVHRVLSRRNPGEALGKAYQLLGEHLPIDAILLWTITGEEMKFAPQWTRKGFRERVNALAQEAYKAFSTPIRLQSSFKKAIEEERPVYVPDISQLPGPAADLVAKHGFRSAFIFPFQIESKKMLLGLIGSRANPLNERQREVLEELFPTFSSVIRAQHYEKKLVELNVTLEERVRRRTYEIQTLHEVTKKFGYTLNYDELFRLVISRLRNVMNFDVAATLLATDQVIDLAIYPTQPLSQEVLQEIKEKLLRAFPEKPSNRKITLQVRELETRSSAPLKRLASSFHVSLPRRPESRTRGVLLIGSEREGAFSQGHVELLNTVVSQASVAVQRLRDFLATQEQRFQTLVETLPEGIVLLNEEKYVVLCNPTAGQYLGVLEGIGPGDKLEKLGDIPIDELLRPSALKAWREVRGPKGRIFEVKCYPVELAPETSYRTLIIRDVTKIRESDRKVRTALEGTVFALASAIDKRDPYTAGHQRRVAELARAIALEMSLHEDLVHGIYIGALIHDLGKISIPSEILVKPGRLSDFEFALIRQHSLEGYNILKDTDFPWPIAEMVLQHHERLDGSGYPEGLKGDDVIIEARIIAVADVVEAMSSHRPYRPALGIERALEEIEENKGRTYDPQVSDACVSLFSKGFEFEEAQS